MNATIVWLENRVPGFAMLTNDERQSISDFSLAWALCEAQRLHSQGTAASVTRCADDLLAKGYDVHVTYCNGIRCNGSTKGALNMVQLEFRVKELIGGLDCWRDDGYPVNRLEPVQPTGSCGCS